jgi:hypothetical protein
MDDHKFILLGILILGAGGALDANMMVPVCIGLSIIALAVIFTKGQITESSTRAKR